jgi:hypothetical protein
MHNLAFNLPRMRSFIMTTIGSKPLLPPAPQNATSGAQSATQDAPRASAFATPVGMPHTGNRSSFAAATSLRPRANVLTVAKPLDGTVSALRNLALFGSGQEQPQIPQAGVLLGSRLVDKKYLMKGNIQQMQKALNVQQQDLESLEMAVAHFGAGAKQIYSNTPIKDVIIDLGYSTPQGILSLCAVADDRTEFFASMRHVDSDMTDSLEDMADNDQDAAIQKAISQGQTLPDIIKNPNLQFPDTAAVSALCDAQIEHDKRHI